MSKPPSPFTLYRRRETFEFRQYVAGIREVTISAPGEPVKTMAVPLDDMAGIGISPEDIAKGHPTAGDMIGRLKGEPDVQWLVTKEQFDALYEPL